MSHRQGGGDDVSRRRILQSGTLLAVSAGLGGTATAQQDGGGDSSAEGGDGADGAGTGTDGAPVLACGETVAGELAGDDDTGFRSDAHYHDVYAFEAAAGDAAVVAMTAPGFETQGVETLQDEADQPPDEEPPGEFEADPYLYLVGPDGAIVAEDDDGGGGLDAFLRVLRLPADGPYYVVATSYGADATFEYELSVACGDVVGQVDAIECGSAVTGELTPADATGFRSDLHAHDAYAFQGTADELVSASLRATATSGDGGTGDDGDAGGQAAPDADTYLYLLGPDGAVVAENDDVGDGVQSGLQAQLPADGEYLLVATSYAPEAYFGYELSLECAGSPDLEPIGCGETVTGSIDPDDGAIAADGGSFYYDVYELQASRGELVTVSMAADRSVTGEDGTASVDDPYLVLLGPDGSVAAEDDDGGGDLNALIRTRLLQEGSYTVVATTYEPDATFPYELSVACEAAPVETPDASSIACGETVFGELAVDDAPGVAGPGFVQDAYAFDGQSGTSVTLSMSSDDGDSLLVLVDPDGEVVASDDDSGGNLDALIRDHQIEQSGEYVAVATSYAPGETFPYALTLQCN